MDTFKQMMALDHGMQVIAEERNRQFAQLGYTIDSDTQYSGGELERAAAYYALPPEWRTPEHCSPDIWPWAPQFYKAEKNDSIEARIRVLAKAGALIAAAISQLAIKASEPTPFDPE